MAEPFKFVPVDMCGVDSPDTFAFDWKQNTDAVDYPSEAFDEVASKKAFRADLAAAKKDCSSVADREYADAYLYAWKAVLDHVDDEPWQTDMNLALQLLEKCVTRHYGTKAGAQCQTDLETNVHRKVTWSTPRE